MPTHNQGDHILDAFAGLKKQSFKDFELVIVVDGPEPKETLWKISEHKPANSVVLQSFENKGTAHALNVGFSICRGEYFTWVSSDNVMDPDWLELMVKHLDTFVEFGAAYSSYRRQVGEIEEGEWCPKTTTHFENGASGSCIKALECHYGPSFLYRAKLHHAHRGAISHDYDWWLRMEEKCEILWVQKALCTYRVPDQRATVVRGHLFDAAIWRDKAMFRRNQ
jgi:glycosyltransferase involved in cell wall biosynthesis